MITSIRLKGYKQSHRHSRQDTKEGKDTTSTPALMRSRYLYVKVATHFLKSSCDNSCIFSTPYFRTSEWPCASWYKVAQDPALTNRQIATQLGCSARSVDLIVEEYSLRQQVEEENGKPTKSKKRRSTASKRTAPAVSPLRAKMKPILKPTSKPTCTVQQYFAAFMEGLEILATEGITVDVECLELLKAACADHSRT